MWLVVNFIDENSVEVVPEDWYIKLTNECLWPTTACKANIIEQYVKEKYLPEQDWTPHKVKVLGHYDTYKLACRKLQKAKDSDKLTTDPEEEGGKRKRWKNLKYVNESESEESRNESDSSLTYPKMPSSQNKSQDRKGLPTYPENTNYSSQRRKWYRTYSKSLSPEPLHTKRSSQVSTQVFIQSMSTKNSMQRAAESAKHVIERASSRSPFLEASDVENFEPETPSVGSNKAVVSVSRNEKVSPIIDILQQMNTKNAEFQQQVLRKLNILNIKLIDIEQRLNAMSSAEYGIQQEDPPEFNDLLNLLPLNEGNLELIENDLNNLTTLNKFAKELSRSGGFEVQDTVKRLMYRLFTNELGSLFSWDGAKGKRKFRELNITKAILNAVRLNKNTTAATDAEIIMHIKKWLARAKERSKRSKLDEDAAARPANLNAE